MGDAYQTTLNILRLVRRLEHAPAAGLPLNAVAEKLGVHRRTVIRYIDALAESADSPPLVREQRGASVWVRRAQSIPAVSATIFQYAAAYAAVLSLQSNGGSVLGDGAVDVLDRVEDGISNGLRRLVPRVGTAFHYVAFAPKSYRDQEDTLDAVLRALLRCSGLRFSYTNLAEKTSKLYVAPYTLAMCRDGLYLLCRWFHDPESELRLFALDRVSDAKVELGTSFEIEADFDPSAYFADHLGVWRSSLAPERVLVAFRPDVMRGLDERRWPGFVSLSEGSDKRLVLELEIPITPEVVSWILTWGRAAEVLGPASLRARVAEELTEASRCYET